MDMFYVPSYITFPSLSHCWDVAEASEVVKNFKTLVAHISEDHEQYLSAHAYLKELTTEFVKLRLQAALPEKLTDTQRTARLMSLADEYVRKHVYRCQTSLVEGFIQPYNGEHEIENWHEYYELVDIDGDLMHFDESEFEMYKNDIEFDLDAFIDEQEQLNDRWMALNQGEAKDIGEDAVVMQQRLNVLATEIPRYQAHFEQLEALDGCPCDRPEIFSWYLVSDPMEYHLSQRQQPILKTDYGTWWGRTMCGQAISCDGVIQSIVDDLRKR